MLKDEIREILETLYLDNRGNTARGDYKEYIEVALSIILSKIKERVPKEKDWGKGKLAYISGYNHCRTDLLKQMEG